MKKIAIQGVAGAFHEIAAAEYFKNEEIEIVECDTFKKLFSTVKKDNSIIGVVAIENTIAGSLLQNHILLKESGLKIAGEQKIRISHCLAGIEGQSVDDVEEAYSHPIALMQCGDFLEHHKNIKAVEWDDTASSARMVAEEKNIKKAAICGLRAAELYGLKILEKGIETNKRNFTRFLVVADPWTTDDLKQGIEINKASLVFTLPHTEGSLAKILSILSYYDMNLGKIQSLPIIGREWEYEFYVNLQFNSYLKYKQSLDAVRPLIKDFDILGEYHSSCDPE